MTPFVQTRLVTYFTDLLGRRLGTEIVIGQVEFRPIESLVLNDVYVKGFREDTLLYCRRLTMRVDSVSFVRRRATITELDFDGALFNLWVHRDEAGSRTNIEMLLDPLARPAADSSRPAASVDWQIALSRIKMTDSRFRYMESQYEPVDYGINWTDVDCRDLCVEVSDISFGGGLYAARVSGLSFREKSGFRVNRMGGTVAIRDDNMLITDTDIRTDKSAIHLDTLEYDWVPDQKYWKYFITRMNQRYVFSNTSVDFDDLAYFNGRLLGMHNVVSGRGVVTGTIDRLNGDHLDLSLGDSTRIRGSFRSAGLPRIFDTDFDIRLDECVLAPAELERLYLPWLDDRYLRFPSPVHKIAAYRLQGDFQGRLGDFVVNASSLTPGAQGDIRLAYAVDTLSGDSSAYRYAGAARLFYVDYALFTELSFLGAGNLRAAFSGEASDSVSRLALQATVPHLNLLDGHLRDIRLTLSMVDDSLRLRSSVADERVAARLNADGLMTDSTSALSLSGGIDVRRWDAIGPDLLGEEESFALDFSGSFREAYEDTNWTLRLANLRYANALGSFALDSASVENNTFGRYRYLRIRSSLFDGTIGGFFDYAQYADLWDNLVYNYFPAYEHAEERPLLEGTSVAFHLQLKELDPLLRVAWPQIRVTPGARADGFYEHSSRAVRLVASADTVAWGDLALRRSRVELSGRGKQMECVYRADEMTYGPWGCLYNVRNHMHVGWNRWDNDLSWSNWHDESYSGSLSATLRLLEYGTRHMAQVSVYPSVIVLADSVWSVERSVILWEDKDIFVNNFEIRRGDQCFRLRGRLGESPRDTLSVEFHHFDLAEFNNILFDNSLALFGTVDGSVRLRDFYGDRLVYADIAVDRWGLNRDTLGSLRAHSYWDAPSKALRLSLVDSLDGAAPVALGGLYHPAADSLDLRLRLDAIDVGRLARYFPDLVDRASGTLSGALAYRSLPGGSDLSGVLSLDTVALRLAPLNAAFTVDDTLLLRGDRLALDRLRLLDPDGNPAECSGYYDWQRGRYDLEVRFDNFRVLDTPPSADGSFYGRLSVSGLARLDNRGGADNLTLALSPGPRSLLCVPLSAAVEEDTGDFLHFVDSRRGPASAPAAPRRPASAWASAPNLDANLEINNNLEVQLIFDPTIGDVLTTVGAGDIKVSLDKDRSLSLFGEYRVERGDYLFTLSNLINKKFVLNPGGTIAWNGDPYDATIDVSAAYNLRTSLGDLLSGTASTLETNVKVPVECVLTLRESLANPSVQFSIDFPSLDTQTRGLLQSLFSSQDEVNKQVFALMILNKFYTPDYMDGDPAQEERNAGAQMGVTTASELLSNQLSRWLSQISNNLDIGFSYRPGDELTANEFELALSTQLFNDRVTVSANGNMQERAKTNSNTAITGDFDVDVKLNRQGTLRLKAYSHTDEKIIYNATETVQGIGISYQETFDTVRELWRKYLDFFFRKKHRSSSPDTP